LGSPALGIHRHSHLPRLVLSYETCVAACADVSRQAQARATDVVRGWPHQLMVNEVLIQLELHGAHKLSLLKAGARERADRLQRGGGLGGSRPPLEHGLEVQGREG